MAEFLIAFPLIMRWESMTWTDVKHDRERVKGLETAHNILHPECQINTREAKNG